VFTAGRAALLVAALTSRPELLLDATDDRLHQPYRLPLVPVTAQLVRVLREAGVAAVLSGSGPTVLALCVGAAQAELAHRIAAGVLGDSGVPAEVLQPDVSRDGCRAEAI
jgi:homoserine kinase